MSFDDSDIKSEKDPSLPEGTFTYRSGISTRKYIGQFKSKDYIGDPIKHGHGKLYDPSGEVIYNGEFKDDLEHGVGEEVYDDGVYYGQFHKGKRHGYGQYNWATGDKYEGNWEEGNFSGEGEYIYLNGNTDKGKWLNHERDGHFVETFNGEPLDTHAGALVRLECNWEYGVRTGRGSAVTKRGRRIEVTFTEEGYIRKKISWGWIIGIIVVIFILYSLLF